MSTPILARVYRFFAWLFGWNEPTTGQVLLEVIDIDKVKCDVCEDASVPDKPEAKPLSVAAPAFIFLSPMDDPHVWLSSPAYDPPASVDIARCQKEIDSIYGTTVERGGEKSIMKLVWNGDRKYWHELYMSWHSNGQPNAPAFPRPRVRFKTFRDKHGKIIRDVFPPRWLILTRLEPEQFPNYTQESWVMDRTMRVFKQIRPDEPPPVYWLWFATIAEHNDHCCGTADSNRLKCFGKYAPPEYIYENLRNQRKADAEQGIKQSPFEMVNESFINEIENDMNGYKMEVAKLQIDAEISIENPWATIGPKAAMKLGIHTTKDARKLVSDYYDKKLQDISSDRLNRQKREKQESGIIL